MPLPAFRRDIPRYTASGVTSAPPYPPGSIIQWLSTNPTLTAGSSRCEGMSSGRMPAMSERSATRAERFAERTDENVATASTSVPPAVASDEMVTQSAMRRESRRPPAPPSAPAVASSNAAVARRSLEVMDPRWHRRLVAPFKGDGEAVQRISAAALLATLAPLGLASSWLAHPHTAPNAALLVTAAVLLLLAGTYLVKRPIPAWVWTVQILAVPAWWYALQLDVTRPPDAFLVLMLVLPVGWVGTWLSLRMTLLSIGLESAALAAAMLRNGGNGLNVLETVAGIAVITVVGLMGYSQIVALREARTAAEADAHTDALTGARSRRYGLLRLEIELDQARTRDAGTPALAMLDIDRFKVVNDAYGHPVGDDVLRELVRRVRSALRPGDELIRWGGEEFLILLPHTADPDAAMAIAERIRCAAAERPFATGAGAIAITVSVGVAAVSDPAETPDAVIARTDAALYAAKRGGRNCVWAARRATSPALSTA